MGGKIGDVDIVIWEEMLVNLTYLAYFFGRDDTKDFFMLFMIMCFNV